MASRTFEVQFIGDTKSLERAYGRAGAASSRFSSNLKRAAKVGAIALGTGLAVGAKKSVDAASDLEESINKASETFDKASPRIEKWSKTTSDSLGLASAEALEGASSIGAMLKPMGVAPSKAASMSKKMTILAADMASFNNEDPTEMLDRIRSGLSGESEPLKRFGAVLSETRVKQHAWKTGIAESGEELTEQQKIMGRYSLLLKDTSDQQGDFGRTSDSLANQQRILKANLTDLAAKIGSVLIPVAKTLTTVMLDVVKWFRDARPSIDNVTQSIGDFATRLGQDENVQSFLAAMQNVGEVMRFIFIETIVPLAKRAFAGLKQAFEGAARAIKGIVKIISGVLTGDFGKAWEGVKDLFKGGVKAALGFFRAMTSPVRDLVSRIGTTIKDGFSSAWGATKDAGRSALDFLKGLPSKFLAAGKAIATAIGKGMQGALNTALRLPATFINKVFDVVSKAPFIDRGSLPTVSAPQIQLLARGGKIERPTAIVGEEAPQHPEFVIATNPAYRARNQELLKQAANALNVPMLAKGGKIGGKALRRAGAAAQDFRANDVNFPDSGFPGWMSGLGSYITDRAREWMKDQAKKAIASIPSGGAGKGSKLAGSGRTSLLAKHMTEKFGLTITDGWRPANATYGASNSSHKLGTPDNPGAHDFVPPQGALGTPGTAGLYAMNTLGAKWADNHDYGSGPHLHVSWFAKGGVIGKLRKKVGRGDKRLARLREILEIAEVEAGFPSSPAGIDLSAGERNRQVSLNERILGRLLGQKSLLGNLQGAIKSKMASIKKAMKKKGTSRNRRQKLRGQHLNLQGELSEVRLALEQIGGVTGKGGEILRVRDTLAALGAAANVPSDASATDNSALVALLTSQLADSRRAFNVSQAQLPVFQGQFGDGGFIKPGHFGIVGDRGPELVGGPANVTPMGGTLRVVVEDHRIRAYMGDKEIETIVDRRVNSISRSRSYAGAGSLR